MPTILICPVSCEGCMYSIRRRLCDGIFIYDGCALGKTVNDKSAKKECRDRLLF